MDKTLEKQFAELRSKTLRETNKAEKEIRKTYKALLKDLQGFVGEEYAKYSKDGKLTYSMLQQKGEYARFLKSVTDHLDGFTPEISKEVLKLVDDVYELNYRGLVDVISKSADIDDLDKALASIKATDSSVVKKSAENKIDKLTLKDTLEYNRAGITYNIRKQISMGLVQGDRYEDMAKRIAKSLDGDYAKSTRIVRTEAHRVREQGLCESAKDCSEAVNKTDSGLVMVKIWRTGQDSRVRDTHSAMEGVTVLVDDEFELPSGAVTLCPGDSGVASEDVNCRCYCSYKLMTIEEYEKASGNKVSQHAKLDSETINDKIDALKGSDYFGNEVVSNKEKPTNLAVSPYQYVGDDTSRKVRSAIKELDEVANVPFGITANDKFTEVQAVSLNKLKTEQKIVSREQLKEMFNNNAVDTTIGEGKYPTVVIFEGDYIILDGNHRATLSKIEGRKTLQARVLNLDNLKITTENGQKVITRKKKK